MQFPNRTTLIATVRVEIELLLMPLSRSRTPLLADEIKPVVDNQSEYGTIFSQEVTP